MYRIMSQRFKTYSKKVKPEILKLGTAENTKEST